MTGVLDFADLWHLNKKSTAYIRKQKEGMLGTLTLGILVYHSLVIYLSRKALKVEFNPVQQIIY